MKTFKVIVAGGRDFNNYDLLKSKLDRIFAGRKDIEIVSGGASGADCWGEKYAADKGLPKKVFLADWDSYGRSAGPRRNTQMAQYADACVCFWDGRSRGTANMIQQAKQFNLKLRVIKY